jgi:hypothetical protein
MTAETHFKYDAAISFLNDDLGMAQRLRDGLAPHVRVFLYADRQQEIAGSDGLVTFRAAFRSDARLIIVLFRSGWGETPWTRIEQQAVEERFLKEGPSFLFFVMLDRISQPPPWLPEYLIRFSMEDYGVDQAIGAIKFRLREMGANFRHETVIERAVRTEEIARFNEETYRLWRSTDGVREATRAALLLIDEVEKIATATRDAVSGLGMELGRKENYSVVRTVKSIFARWLGKQHSQRP